MISKDQGFAAGGYLIEYSVQLLVSGVNRAIGPAVNTIVMQSLLAHWPGSKTRTLANVLVECYTPPISSLSTTNEMYPPEHWFSHRSGGSFVY